MGWYACPQETDICHSAEDYSHRACQGGLVLHRSRVHGVHFDFFSFCLPPLVDLPDIRQDGNE